MRFLCLWIISFWHIRHGATISYSVPKNSHRQFANNCLGEGNRIENQHLFFMKLDTGMWAFQDVLHRHALYLIVRMVCYDDGLGAGKSLLALKTTDASYEEYSLWIYQCNSLVRLTSNILFKKIKRCFILLRNHLQCALRCSRLLFQPECNRAVLSHWVLI